MQKRRSLDPFENELVNIVKEGAGSNDAKDEYDHFALSMASKLRKLNDLSPREAIDCQFKIHQILHQSMMDFM